MIVNRFYTYKLKTVDFDVEIIKKRQKNYEAAVKALENKEEWLINKIRKHADKYDLTFESVLKDIDKGKNTSLMCLFAKQADKQSNHQAIAFDYISKTPFFDKSEMLPAGGPESIYISDGEILKINELNGNRLGLKSIDFKFTYTYKGKSLVFYATHKFTTNNGGAQDNQFNDIVAFVKNASPCKDTNIRFLAILDGIYYKRNYLNQVENKRYEDKITFVNQTVANKNTKAVSCLELHSTVGNMIKEWLKENFDENLIKNEVHIIDKLIEEYTAMYESEKYKKNT